MAKLAPGKFFTKTMVNKDLRSISSVFVNQSDEIIETDDYAFAFQGKDETFLSCDSDNLRRIQAQTAFVGVQYTDFANVFNMPKDKAVEVAQSMGAERAAKQKELYG